MFFDTNKDAYKLLFRDGTDIWRDGEQLDEDIHENDIRFNLAQKHVADQEPWSPAVDQKLNEYGPYAVTGLRVKMNRAARQVGTEAVTKAPDQPKGATTAVKQGGHVFEPPQSSSQAPGVTKGASKATTVAGSNEAKL